MQFSKGADEAHVFIEVSEDERMVLRAIVRASFELAQPVGLSVVDYNSNDSLTDLEADQWIKIGPRKYDSRIVDMTFVKGRQCMTLLSKEAAAHFRLDVRFYERYRDDCLQMLQRAEELLGNRFSDYPADATTQEEVRAFAATT